MIMPSKHIDASRAILGVGATLLQHLGHPKTVTALWENVRNISYIGTFERFTLALDFLYMIDAVDFENGLLQRRTK